MEVLLENKEVGSLLEFGLCGGELSCQTCMVDIVKGYDALPKPSMEEQDIFDKLGS